MSAKAVVVVRDAGRAEIHVANSGYCVAGPDFVTVPDGIKASTALNAKLATMGWTPVDGSEWERPVVEASK